MRYHAFDLLYLDGYDLRGAAYEDRTHLLQRLLKNAPETFINVEALAADGNEILDKGCKLGLGVPRENILQLLPEAVAPSKEELADYWTRVWNKALSHLGHRPLKLVRHVHGTTFYHKGPLPKDIPPAVHQLRIEKREGGQGTRLWVDSLDGFLGLVEIGAVELHPWNATVEDFEHADRIVIDLDPGEGVDWDAVV